jgi:hypothetical protein
LRAADRAADCDYRRTGRGTFPHRPGVGTREDA